MILSVNNINQFIFETEKCCVFFDVRTAFLNIIQRSFGFKGSIISDEMVLTKYLILGTKKNFKI
jgi:hypothetical protein